jgi:hypothetical protein
MNEISSQSYKEISDIYASVYGDIVEAQNRLVDAVEYAASNLSVEPKVELLRPLYNAKVTYENLDQKRLLLSAVAALNRHVQNKSGKNLNVWLQDNNVKVRNSWAYLSELSGYMIETENIEY